MLKKLPVKNVNFFTIPPFRVFYRFLRLSTLP